MFLDRFVEFCSAENWFGYATILFSRRSKGSKKRRSAKVKEEEGGRFGTLGKRLGMTADDDFFAEKRSCGLNVSCKGLKCRPFRGAGLRRNAGAVPRGFGTTSEVADRSMGEAALGESACWRRCGFWRRHLA